MTTAQWQIQQAKSQFSQLIDAAMQGAPQHITRHGKAAVVVLSEQEFQSLQRGAHAAAPGFVSHLLAIPKEDEVPSQATLKLREIDF